MDDQITAYWEFFGIVIFPILATLGTFIYRYYTDDVIYRDEAEKKGQSKGWGVYGAIAAPENKNKNVCDRECWGYYCGVHNKNHSSRTPLPH